MKEPRQLRATYEIQVGEGNTWFQKQGEQWTVIAHDGRTVHFAAPAGELVDAIKRLAEADE